MLYLNLNEGSSDRDPKESIEEALHVAQVLQVGVKLVFNGPWLGLTIQVDPADQLESALARFDAQVERHREYYMRGHVSISIPPRPGVTPIVSTDLG